MEKTILPEQILRSDGNGNILYDMNWPYSGELRDFVANGSLKNIFTDFLRVGVKPEACKESVELDLERLALSAALIACSKMPADYVVLSKNSIRELQSRDTGDTIYATYVATFYARPTKR